MQSDGFVLAVPPRRRFCSTQIPTVSPVPFPVHPRSLQAATDLSSLLELRFLEDPPPSVPKPDKDGVCVCVGSGSVARITLNICVCDQAQNNCIMKGRWTGGARSKEKPQLLEKMDRK